MAIFHYKALAADGRTRLGTLTVDDDRAAARELRKQGLTPIFIGSEKPGGFSLTIPGFGRKAKSSDLLHFTEEIATLLNAGVTLDRSLEITAELTERPQFKAVVQNLQKTLRGGKSFADTLAAEPDVFGELYVSMVRAGEVSGSLSIVMDRLADFERERDELRGYIVSSLTYPALLVCVGSTSIFILLRYVIPRFAEAFADSNIAMPLPMEILLTISNVVQTYGFPFIGLLIAAAFGIRNWTRSEEGRLKWDRFKLRIPLLGQALLKADTARFARAMGTLVQNSVPLVQALSITKGVMSNQLLGGALDFVAKGVKRGEGIASPMKKAAMFPALAGHLLTVGEETGRLDEMFNRMADIYEKDTKEAVKRFTALFEPAVILVMGVIVGAMILSVMLAITSINQLGM
jgi:general secretion pathway protein F